MIKLFFKSIRAILGPLLILADKLLPPRKVPANRLNQEAIAQAATHLTLYQFVACPFCIKVRRQIKRLRLPLETRNILQNAQWHDELVNEGGTRKVPCLRIEHDCGDIEWLYDSKSINAYLAQRFLL